MSRNSDNMQSFDHNRRRASIYMWSFGSNLNVRQMKRRAPDAKKIKPLPVYGCKLVFRGVADVELTDNPQDVALGGLWKISAADERDLDRYEGLRSGMYEKKFFYIRDKSRHYHKVMYYKMTQTDGVFPPSDTYLGSIIEGYEDFGLDVTKLDEALRASWDDKNKTDDMRQRYLRDRPTLARDMGSARRPLITADPPKSKRLITPASEFATAAQFSRAEAALARMRTSASPPPNRQTQMKFHQPSWPSNIGSDSKLLPAPNSSIAKPAMPECPGCKTAIVGGQADWTDKETGKRWHWMCHYQAR